MWSPRSAPGTPWLAPSTSWHIHDNLYSNESFIIKGRKSFPSGHSSTAFSGFALLAIWSAEQLGAWAFSRPMPVHSWKSTRLGRLLLTLIPISWATFVALSRMSDYVRLIHHQSLRCDLTDLLPASSQRGYHCRVPHWNSNLYCLVFSILAQPILRSITHKFTHLIVLKPRI